MADKVQLIKQEIERRITFHNNRGSGFDTAIEDVLFGIKSFIDSLPEESADEANCTPENDNLEEVAEKFYDNCNITKSSWWDEGILRKMSESKETFIAGAKWMEKQIMKDLIVK